jgi:nicotinic acid mononucleotide adenylyltransferase
MGVPFQSQFLSQSGASSTILFTHSPYHRSMQPECDRAVSAEMALKLSAKDLFVEIEDDDVLDRFAIAVTASHKSADERGDSHGWIAVSTHGKHEGDHLLHFNLKKQYYIKVGDETKKKIINRGYAGAVYAYLLKWFLDKILLNKWETWQEAIENMPSTTGDVISIDVISSPEMTIEDHLLLASEKNPLIFHNGSFRRVADYLRKHNRIVRGSFNPPTKYHEAIGEDALFETDISNARKGRISLTDLAHRLSMLSLTGRPVMINCGFPLFADLHRSLRERGLQGLEYVVGSDTFNDIANPKYIPYDGFLEPFYIGGSGKLLVAIRGDVVDNEYSVKLNFETIEVDVPMGCSSTKAREGDLSWVSDNIAEYIKENNLYGL